MKILFGYSLPDYKITSLTWKDADGLREVVLLTDGSLKMKELEMDSLYWATKHWFSSYAPCIAVEIKDIATAQKYIGKSVDLVELLPKARILPED